MTDIYFANIVDKLELSSQDYPDPNNWAVEVFFCGCDFLCKSCCNPLLRNYNNQTGTKVYYVHNLITKVTQFCEQNGTNKIVLLGGDPLSKVNREFTKELVAELSMEYDICVYTGHSIELVKNINLTGFQFVKCGTFDDASSQISEKTDEYLQLASQNQILYDKDLKQLSEKGKYYFKGANIEG